MHNACSHLHSVPRTSSLILTVLKDCLEGIKFSEEFKTRSTKRGLYLFIHLFCIHGGLVFHFSEIRCERNMI